MARRTVEVDGEQVTLITERGNDDGGTVADVYVPDGSGGHFYHRVWRGRGVKPGDAERPMSEVNAEKRASEQEAESHFTNAEAPELRHTVQRARDGGVRATLPPE